MNRKNEIRNSSRILLSLALVLLVAVTAGVSYAIYDYTDLVKDENTINTSTINFLYDNKNGMNNDIIISDNLPMSDDDGKMLVGISNVFDFQILASNNSKDITYEIAIRKSNDSSDIDDNIKIYLVELLNKEEKETPLTINDNKVIKYSELKQSTLVDEDISEKVIYQDNIKTNSKDYEKNFRLRMWIADDANFNPTKDKDGNIVYPFDGKNFKITINVYSNVTVINNEL